jgi:hypothetical protein
VGDLLKILEKLAFSRSPISDPLNSIK